MPEITLDQAKQAKDHLVTVRTAYTDYADVTREESITGILDNVTDFEDGTFDLGITSGYRPGAYEFTDERIGSHEGLLVPSGDVVEFTDHGERSDALLHISQKVAAREHALQAVRDAEDDIKRAYQSVTNLTAQEG